MHADMISYLKTLSNHDYEKLTDIIENKYFMFREVYYILKNYSDIVSVFKYHETDKDTLKIEFAFANNVDEESILHELTKSVEDTDILIRERKGKYVIELKK